MHVEALAYVAVQAHQHGPFGRVLDLGGRDINGSPRPLFGGAEYVAVDMVGGPGVDVVGDARFYQADRPFDVVLCLEVLEHVGDPWAFLESAWANLRPGGRLIATMACNPRAPHSAFDGGQVRDGEFYENVREDDLAKWLGRWDDVQIEIHDDRGDLYVSAVRGV